jgi:hypothetical protein
VCQDNSKAISAEAFLAGCNRFGIDNPAPIITKRLSLYGVNEELEKDFKRLVEKYRREYPDIKIDPNVHGPAELKAAMGLEGLKAAKQTWDFKETSVKSPLKKSAGIINLSVLTPKNVADVDQEREVG